MQLLKRILYFDRSIDKDFQEGKKVSITCNAGHHDGHTRIPLFEMGDKTFL